MTPRFSLTSVWESGWIWIQKNRWTLLFLAAFAIRLVNLNQSLWLDEAISAQAIQQNSSRELVKVFALGDFHPPLYYLVLQAWSKVWGTSEVALRSLSILAVLIGAWAVKFAAEHAPRKVHPTITWWTTAFVLFNPILIYYSQEARMYGWIIGLIGLNIACVALAWRRPGWLSLAGLVLTTLFSLWSFYGSVLWFVPLGLLLLWRKKWTLATTLLLTGLLALATLAPLLQHQLSNAQEALQLVPNWSETLGKLDVKNLILIPLKLTSGRISFEPKALYFLLAGVWVVWLGTSMLRALQQQPRLAWLLTAPVFLAMLLSIWTPMIQYFRFLFLVFPLSLAVAQGQAAFPRWVRWATLFGFGAWSLFAVVTPSQHREDWKSLMALEIFDHAPTAMVLSSQDPVQYYRPMPLLSLREVLESGSSEPTIIVLPYTAAIHGLDIPNNLTKQGYSLQEEYSVRGLSAQVWARAATNDTISEHSNVRE